MSNFELFFQNNCDDNIRTFQNDIADLRKNDTTRDGKIKSISDERFNSPAPSLPNPKIIRGGTEPIMSHESIS